MDPDRDLLERWCAGDALAGEDLFARHVEELYRFVAALAPAEVDDLIRRVFLACLHGDDGPRGTVRTHLLGLARRELYRDARQLELDEPVDFATVSAERDGTAAGADHSVGGDAVRAALRQLPMPQQVLLALHAWHGLDVDALAEVLDVPTAELPAKLARAHDALRTRLRES